MMTSFMKLTAATVVLATASGLAACRKKEEPAPPVSAVSREAARKGERIFADNCTRCHSIRGVGGTTGPDLSGVAGRRDIDYIRQQLRDPKSHKKDTVMPSFEHMSEEERDAVISYLMTIYMLKSK